MGRLWNVSKEDVLLTSIEEGDPFRGSTHSYGYGGDEATGDSPRRLGGGRALSTIATFPPADAKTARSREKGGGRRRASSRGTEDGDEAEGRDRVEGEGDDSGQRLIRGTRGDGRVMEEVVEEVHNPLRVPAPPR